MENQHQEIDVNLKIVSMMSKGMKQQEVSDELKRLGISPNSLSIIEKRLKAMRTEHNAKTIIHLFVKLCKKGII